MTYQISRRSLITSALGTGVLSLLPGFTVACSSGDKPVGPPTVRKVVHLSMPGRSALLAETQYIELRVGVRTYRCEVHSTETRKRAVDRASARKRMQDARDVANATHFAADVAFSARGAQSFSAYAIRKKGAPLLFAAGIHVPNKEDLGIGDPSTDPTPDHLVTPEDAAVWAVFNNPHIMAHAPNDAAAIIDIISKCPSYAALVNAIATFPQVRDPDHDMYAGWVYGRYRSYKNSDGSVVPVYEMRMDGTTVLGDDGNPLQAIDWELSDFTYPTRGVIDSVKTVANRVTLETVSAFNDDPSYEGRRYFRYDAVPAQNDQGVPNASSALGAEESEGFTFSAEGATTEHRTMFVELEKEKFSVKVKNHLALGCSYGVSHFDDTGKHIKTNVLGYIPSTYYPSPTAFFPSSGESSFDRPTNALTTNLWTCAPACHHGNYGPGGDQVNFTGRAFVAWSLSILLDIVIPGTFLSLGLVEAREGSEKILEAILDEAGQSNIIEANLDFFVSQLGSVYNLGAGANVGTVLLDIGEDLVKVLIRLIGKTFLQRFAGAMAEMYAEHEAESTVLLSTPIVGWAVFAAELALTGTQLAFTTAHFATSTVFTSGVIHYTHAVKCTVRPQGSTYFPSGVMYAKCTITMSLGETNFTNNQKVVSFEIKRDDKGFEYFEIEFSNVPILAPFNAQFSFFDAHPDGPAHANTLGDGIFKDIANVSKQGQAQDLDFDVEFRPLPVDRNTDLHHDVILTPTVNGYAWSAADAPVPTADATLTGSLTGLAVRQTEDKVGLVSFHYTTTAAPPQAGPTPMMASVPMAPSKATQVTPAQVRVTPASTLYTRRLVMGIDGETVVLAQATSGDRIAVHLIPESEGEFDLATWKESDATLYALSRTNYVSNARISPTGQQLLLTSENTVEVFSLGGDRSLSAKVRTSSIVKSPGTAIKNLSRATAAAGFHHENQMAVLDEGNRRVTIFTYDGAFVPYFDNGRGDLPLVQDKNRNYLDVDVDVLGNIWVLSREPGAQTATTYLDIYGQSGAKLVALTKVQADRFSLDRFNQVFTLNRQMRQGPLGYAVPTVSRWYTTSGA